MNQFTLLVIILVVFTYYGGSNVPKVLKDNKEILLGVVGGLVLCSFLGMRLEGVIGGTGATGSGTGGNGACEELTGPSIFGELQQLNTKELCLRHDGRWDENVRPPKCCTE